MSMRRAAPWQIVGPGAGGKERWDAEVVTAGQRLESVSPATRGQLERVCGVALLAGAVSSSSIARRTGRSALDLPLGDGGPSVAQHWLEAVETLSHAGASGRAWVLVDEASPAPRAAPDGALEVRRDKGGLRGAGGALRDLAVDLDPGGRLLVIIGVQALLHPIGPIAEAMSQLDADIALLDGPLQAPGSIMLASCAALSAMRAVGFVDLKEQGLPELARRFNIRVAPFAQRASAPLRTREEYIATLRTLALRRGAGPDDVDDPLAERWRPAFGISEPGAVVGDGARLCDSVALRSARIGAGATLVRSVVAGEVAPGATIVDDVVSAPGQGDAS